MHVCILLLQTNLTWKERLNVCYPVSSPGLALTNLTMVSSMSLEGHWNVLLLAEPNEPKLCAADIAHAYLEANTREKLQWQLLLAQHFVRQGLQAMHLLKSWQMSCQILGFSSSFGFCSQNLWLPLQLQICFHWLQNWHFRLFWDWDGATSRMWLELTSSFLQSKQNWLIHQKQKENLAVNSFHCHNPRLEKAGWMLNWTRIDRCCKQTGKTGWCGLEFVVVHLGVDRVLADAMLRIAHRG